MTDLAPQFETEDLLGQTTQFTGTVGTTSTAFPTVATTSIAECLIRCPSQTPNSNRLLYSFDGGTTFGTLAPGEFIGWSLKGSPTQIRIKGNVASVNYEIILNKEPT